MYTVQLDSPFAASNEAGLTKSYTPNSTPDNKPAQTDAAKFDMNYENNNTNGLKPQPATCRKEMYYPQQQQQQPEDWVVTNASTPSTDSFNNNGNRQSSPKAGQLDDEMQQRHMQQLFDKKRRRRESHNAVERRRRDNINERIFELSTLLPERDASKNNKGTILRKSVNHIRLLHDKVNQYQQRVQELENMLEMYRMRWGDAGMPMEMVQRVNYQQQQPQQRDV